MDQSHFSFFFTSHTVLFILQEKYGGHGFSHILDNVVPKMLARGLSQSSIDKILIHNPRTWMTFK